MAKLSIDVVQSSTHRLCMKMDNVTATQQRSQSALIAPWWLAIKAITITKVIILSIFVEAVLIELCFHFVERHCVILKGVNVTLFISFKSVHNLHKGTIYY